MHAIGSLDLVWQHVRVNIMHDFHVPLDVYRTTVGYSSSTRVTKGNQILKIMESKQCRLKTGGGTYLKLHGKIQN
jgi:hypothetical protein